MLMHCARKSSRCFSDGSITTSVGSFSRRSRKRASPTIRVQSATHVGHSCATRSTNAGWYVGIVFTQRPSAKNVSKMLPRQFVIRSPHFTTFPSGVDVSFHPPSFFTGSGFRRSVLSARFPTGTSTSTGWVRSMPSRCQSDACAFATVPGVR